MGHSPRSSKLLPVFYGGQYPVSRGPLLPRTRSLSNSPGQSPKRGSLAQQQHHHNSGMRMLRFLVVLGIGLLLMSLMYFQVNDSPSIRSFYVHCSTYDYSMRLTTCAIDMHCCCRQKCPAAQSATMPHFAEGLHLTPTVCIEEYTWCLIYIHLQLEVGCIYITYRCAAKEPRLCYSLEPLQLLPVTCLVLS
jgi:hypothetical protein